MQICLNLNVMSLQPLYLSFKAGGGEGKGGIILTCLFYDKSKNFSVTPSRLLLVSHRPELFHDPLQGPCMGLPPAPPAAKQRLAFPSCVLGSEKGVGVTVVLRSTNESLTSCFHKFFFFVTQSFFR